MKISAKQLETVIRRLQYLSRGYDDKTDVVVDISMTQEDPGNGIMVDCLTLKAEKLPGKDDEDEDRHTTTTMEIYPASEGVEPRAIKTETFKVKKHY